MKADGRLHGDYCIHIPVLALPEEYVKEGPPNHHGKLTPYIFSHKRSSEGTNSSRFAKGRANDDTTSCASFVKKNCLLQCGMAKFSFQFAAVRMSIVVCWVKEEQERVTRGVRKRRMRPSQGWGRRRSGGRPTSMVYHG